MINVTKNREVEIFSGGGISHENAMRVINPVSEKTNAAFENEERKGEEHFESELPPPAM